jgi:hypothetical protein
MKYIGVLYAHLVYFMAIWYILWPFGIFMVIWYILSRYVATQNNAIQ